MEPLRTLALVSTASSIGLSVRVLHVVPSFYPAISYGGPIYSVLNLCLNLGKLGCEVKVLTTDANRDSRLTPQEQQDPLLDPLRVQFCRRVGRGMISPELLQRLPGEIGVADIVHLTGVYNFATFPVLLSTQLRRKPLVWSPRGALQRWSGSRRKLTKGLWDAACRFTLPRKMTLHLTSHCEATESIERVGAHSVCVVPNGVEIPSDPPPPIRDGLLKLLYMGRLDPKKGIDNLISSLPMFSRSGGRRFHLKIAGEGPRTYVNSLQKLANDTGIGDQVEFCGHVSGPERYDCYANSDAVVIPSHTENFGMVVAEALAHARPVIASRATPWPGIQEHGCGLWVDNSPASLASAIDRLSRSDLRAMGQRGRAWMIRDFSWLDCAKRMLRHYELLLGV